MKRIFDSSGRRSKITLDIQLDQQQYYFGGDEVRGNVLLESPKLIKIKNIRLLWYGRVRVDLEPGLRDEKKLFRETAYVDIPASESESELIKRDGVKHASIAATSSIGLMIPLSPSKNTYYIESNKLHKYPFSFTVPEKPILPSCTESETSVGGIVEYVIEAYLERPASDFSASAKAKIHVPVLQRIDTARPELAIPQSVYVECKQSSISQEDDQQGIAFLSASVPCKAFLRNQPMPVTVEIKHFEPYKRSQGLMIALIRTCRIICKGASYGLADSVLHHIKADIDISEENDLTQVIVRNILIPKAISPTVGVNAGLFEVGYKVRIRAQLQEDNTTAEYNMSVITFPADFQSLAYMTAEIPIDIGTLPLPDDHIPPPSIDPQFVNVFDSYTPESTTKEITTKEATAKETTAKETTAKETTAKETTTKEATAKETTAKETTAKETATKETAAKETIAKETIAKETAAKETAAKETAAKETTAKETIAKEKETTTTNEMDTVKKRHVLKKMQRLLRRSSGQGPKSDAEAQDSQFPMTKTGLLTLFSDGESLKKRNSLNNSSEDSGSARESTMTETQSQTTITSGEQSIIGGGHKMTFPPPPSSPPPKVDPGQGPALPTFRLSLGPDFNSETLSSEISKPAKNDKPTPSASSSSSLDHCKIDSPPIISHDQFQHLHNQRRRINSDSISMDTHRHKPPTSTAEQIEEEPRGVSEAISGNGGVHYFYMFDESSSSGEEEGHQRHRRKSTRRRRATTAAGFEKPNSVSNNMDASAGRVERPRTNKTTASTSYITDKPDEVTESDTDSQLSSDEDLLDIMQRRDRRLESRMTQQ